MNGKLLRQWAQVNFPAADLAKMDPNCAGLGTCPLTEAIPSGGGVVRNMVATPNGTLYLACSGVNKVAIVRLGSK